MKASDKQPLLLAAVSSVIIGLASFVVYLLRLKPDSKQRLAPDSPQGSLQVSATSEKPIPKPLSTSTTTTPEPNHSLASHQAPVPSTHKTPGVIKNSVTPPSDQGQDPEEDSTEWTAPTRYLAGVGIFLFFVFLIFYSRQTLSLLIFAALIAILAQPFSNYFQKRLRFSRSLSIAVTYLLVAALIVVVPLLIIPNVANGINSFLSYDWEGLLETVSKTFDQTADRISTIPLVGTSLANSLNGLSQLFQGWLTAKPESVSTDPSETLSQLGQAVGILGGLVAPLISGIMSLVFMLLISLQISLSGELIRAWIINPVPRRFKKEINNLLDRIQFVWVSFLRGEFTLMVVMGVLTWLLNVILGTPQAVLLGFLAGLLEVVPSLGPILATIPAAIFALIFGSSVFPGLNPWIFMLIVILGYVLLQAIENQVLVPKILGDAVSLPPLIVLVGVTIAGSTAGVAGVFLATPVMATGREILNYVYDKVIAIPEAPQPDEDQPSIMDQLSGFLKNLHLPTRRHSPRESTSQAADNTEQ